MIRALLTVSVTFLVSSVTAAQPTTLRISCEGFDGNRVQYAGHANSPPAQFRRLVKSEDAITGLKLEITFSTAEKTAKVTSFGNVNTGGRVTNMDVVQLESSGKLSFVGVDNNDGSINLFSYFMDLGRLIWTIHSDKIYVMDKMAVGKTFFANCTLKQL